MIALWLRSRKRRKKSNNICFGCDLSHNGWHFYNFCAKNIKWTLAIEFSIGIFFDTIEYSCDSVTWKIHNDTRLLEKFAFFHQLFSNICRQIYAGQVIVRECLEFWQMTHLESNYLKTCLDSFSLKSPSDLLTDTCSQIIHLNHSFRVNLLNVNSFFKCK